MEGEEHDQKVTVGGKGGRWRLLLCLSRSLRFVCLCGMANSENCFVTLRTRYSLNSHNLGSLLVTPHPYFLRSDFDWRRVLGQIREYLGGMQQRANPQFSYWLCFLLSSALARGKDLPPEDVLGVLTKYTSLCHNIQGTSLQPACDELVGEFLLEHKEADFDLKEVALVRTIFEFSRVGQSARVLAIRRFLYENWVDNLLVFKILGNDEQLLEYSLAEDEVFSLADIVHKFVMPQCLLVLQAKDLPEGCCPAGESHLVYRHRHVDTLLHKGYKKMAERIIGKALFWLQKNPNEEAVKLLMQAVARYSVLYQEDLLALAESTLPAKTL